MYWLKHLFPTKYQYRRWSKPAKYSFWGFLITVLASMLTVFFRIQDRANPAPNIDEIKSAVEESLDPFLQKTHIFSFSEIGKLIRNSSASLRSNSNSEELTEDELTAGFNRFVAPHRDNWSLFYRAEAALKALQRKGSQEVLDCLDKGLELAPNDLPLLYDRARFLVFAMQTANAKTAFEKVRRALLDLPPQRYPSQFSVELALANYAYMEKKYLEVLPIYELALSHMENTGDTTSYDVLIFEHLKGRYSGGLFLADDRGKVAEFMIRRRLGEIYALLGRHTEAMHQLEVGLELKKNPKVGRFTAFLSTSGLILELAFINAYSGDVEKAIELANRVLELQPAYVVGFSEPSDLYLHALVVKGVAFARQGYSKKALAYFARYFSNTEGKFPESVDSTYYALAIAMVVAIQSASGSPEEGLKHISKLEQRYKISDLDLGIQMELAVATAYAYYHLGDTEKLRETINATYEIRQKLPPTNFVTDANLFFLQAQYFESEGRLPEAISFEDRALKILDELDSSQAIELRKVIMSARQRRSTANGKE